MARLSSFSSLHNVKSYETHELLFKHVRRRDSLHTEAAKSVYTSAIIRCEFVRLCDGCVAAAKLFDALSRRQLHASSLQTGGGGGATAVGLCVILTVFKIKNMIFHSIANTKIILEIKPEALTLFHVIIVQIMLSCVRGACDYVWVRARARRLRFIWLGGLLSTRALYRYGLAAVANHCDKKEMCKR